MSKTQWYIGAPNGVMLCVNEVHEGQLRGLLYHSYREDGLPFENAQQMILHMEALYDELHFPHPGTNGRSFTETKTPKPATSERKEKIMSDDKLLQRHGDIGTFIVRVQHRQNSSWQGRITWMEEDKTLYFRSVWEMVKLIESAVNVVSSPEDDEAEPTWGTEAEP